VSAFDADLAVLNADCLAAFGDPLVYTPQSSSAFTIAVTQTDRNKFAIDPIPAQYAVRWCKLADFPAGVTPARGDTFAIGTDTFNVVEIRFEEGGGGVYIVGDKQ
jgi:hypothetical protein